MMPPSSDDEPASALRRRLVDALSRGRPGTTPPRVSREHSLPPERRADGIVVQRVMLAPEPGDGREHAVPVVLVHRRCDEEDRSRPRPVVAFLHGTGGDTEGLLDTHLVPLAERGYVAVGVDAPCHGRRLDPEKPARDTTKSAAEKTTKSAAAAAAAAAGRHRALVRPRAETFERYGAALVAACRGASDASDTSDSERRPNVARTSKPDAGGYSGASRPFLFDGAWDVLRALRFVRRWSAASSSSDDVTRDSPEDDSTRGSEDDEEFRVRLPPTDPGRFAVTGISLGGMHSWLAAAAAPEVVTGGCAPMIGAQDFGWALENDLHAARVASLPPALFEEAERVMRETEEVTSAREREAEDPGGDGVVSATRRAGGEKRPIRENAAKVVSAETARFAYSRIAPGLADALDGPRTMPLIAPRPLLLLNGEIDPRCPLGGLERVVRATRAAYDEAEGGGGDGEGDRAAAASAFRAFARVGAAHECGEEMLATLASWLDATLDPGDDGGARRTFRLADERGWREL